MSDTPRTNKFKRTVGVPWWEFAGQLERELAASQAKLFTVFQWINRNYSDGFIDSLTHLQNLERVSDLHHDRLDSLEASLTASQAAQAELLARLEEARKSHLHAAARDVQTIQQQAVELAKWQALAEGLAVALTDCKNRAMDKSIETHADDNAKGCVDDIWEWSEQALAAYEAAKSANHD
jgi:hypothetical protein